MRPTDVPYERELPPTVPREAALVRLTAWGEIERAEAAGDPDAIIRAWGRKTFRDVATQDPARFDPAEANRRLAGLNQSPSAAELPAVDFYGGIAVGGQDGLGRHRVWGSE